MSTKVMYQGNIITTIDTNTSKILNTQDKYCENNIVVENIEHSRAFFITLSNDMTARGDLTTITDIDILNHRNDPSMSACLEALFTVDARGIIYFLTRNRNVGTTGNSLGLRLLNNAYEIITSNKGIYSTNTDQNGAIILLENGVVRSQASTNVPLKAGNYRLTFSWGDSLTI